MVSRTLPAAQNAQRLGLAFGEMDRWFDRFFAGESTPTGWLAPMATWDENDRTYVEMELPGVTKDELEIVVQDGKLLVAAERKLPTDGRQYRHNERRYGRFERLFALPETVDPESITAELTDGVLLVSLARRPEAQPRRIEIQTR